MTTTAPPTTTLAWHGDPALKADVLARMRQHRAEDSIVQGLYQQFAPALASGYRGCLIGCTLPRRPPARDFWDDRPAAPSDGWHGEVERLYGIPRPVGHLLDALFERLPASDCAEFAVASIETIPVAADLTLVSGRLLLDILADDERGVRLLTADGSDQRRAVDAVAALCRRRLAGAEPAAAEWTQAAEAAWAAEAAAEAAWAADAAAWAAASAAAGAAAEAAAWAAGAAGAAVRAAAWAAQAAGASQAAWAADRLLHHLRSAPVANDPRSAA